MHQLTATAVFVTSPAKYQCPTINSCNVELLQLLQLLLIIIGLDLKLTMVNFQLLPTIIDDNWPVFPINYVEFSIVANNC